ncbi:MAG: FG-GAP-like repeat-containing protein [Verrucomicrobiota bacterium]|nr:FG-GAP-like repeat-containing protein [Verrucomicrobiota bacterium]
MPSGLIALEWKQQGQHRLAKLTVKPSERNGFQLMPPRETGVSFVNRLSRQLVARNRNLANGSGVAVGDVDGDGLPDLYFCGLQTDNRLYRNLGHWTFEDVTANSGAACSRQYSTGALIADIDGDSDNDLLVTGLAKGTRLFLNDGSGKFTENADSGLFPKLGATSMAMADIDSDGDLDLYVANYRTTNYKDRPPGVNPEVRQENGALIVTPANRFVAIKTSRNDGVHLVELGEQDFLYENLGAGRFRPVKWTGGRFLDVDGIALKKPPLDWGLSVMMRDVNGDLLPDIYVCNDFFYSVDKFWINQGGGVFRQADHEVVRNFSMSSMSVDFADINGDGYDDFFVADMLSMRNEFRKTQRGNTISGELNLPITDARFQPEFARNTLQLNRGDNTYAEIAQLAGLHASEWTWASRFLDVDLDGHQDLIMTTGNESDVLDADMMGIVANSPKTRESHFQNMMRFPSLQTPNLIFRNGGDLRFSETSTEWGFGQVGISNGMAAGDLDNDGDLDLVINNLNSPAFLLENIGSANRIAFRLKGNAPNSAGVGATVELMTGKIHQKQAIIAGGRYLSGDQPLCVFGIPHASPTLSAKIKWPDGSISAMNNLAPNTVFEISQATAKAGQHAASFHPQPLFDDASSRLNVLHAENPRIDPARSPAASGLGELGPGVCAADVNGDGLDELFVGNGKGGTIIGLQLNNAGLQQSGVATRLEWGDSAKLIRDTAAILVYKNDTFGLALLTALSSYEDGLAVGPALNAVAREGTIQLLPASHNALGPVSMADVDGDGQLDLFTGGRARRNDPFLTVDSALHKGSSDGFTPTAGGRVLAGIGPVSGSVFSDIDNDGDPDLILARQWNCPMLLLNNEGHLVDATEEWGLSEFHGLWNGVTTGDFNNDGWTDLLMTNAGLNTGYSEHLSREVWLHVSDFNQDGVVDGVESVYDSQLEKRVPVLDRQSLAKVLPWVTGLFQSHRAFAQADIATLLEPAGAPPVIRKLNTLVTTVFLNNGVSFKKTKLPVEAHFAPSFGCSVADFDGDGNDDAYLAQNYFNVNLETSRHDAGLGLVLLGDGRGGFRALSRAESGVANLGQARGCTVSDFDGDGRVDLVTAQNNSRVKLHLNATGKTGVRVELIGGHRNPQAVGASVRLEKAGVLGPKRELRLGSGYFSQDSLAQVFADAGSGSKLHITWPDKTVAAVSIPDGAKNIEIAKPDEVRIVH